MKITGLYAALMALLVVVLALRVVMFRRSARIGLGDGNNPDLLKRIRVHGNAVEYVPFYLLLMLILELNQTAPILIHAFGIVLVVARLMHAWGVSRHSGITAGRALGAGLTVLMMVLMALLLLWQFFAMAIISAR
ncbi:MAG TPA: MAPEG family protein [Rudaea sp.]|jgi:hypothetical protein|nr:MAPEG family protein [Rudaea sp.]